MLGKLIGHVLFDIGALCIPFSLGFFYQARDFYVGWNETPIERAFIYLDAVLLFVLGCLLLWLTL